MVNVADFFKSPNEDRPKLQYDYSQGITSYSNNVYSKNFTPSYPASNNFSSAFICLPF